MAFECVASAMSEVSTMCPDRGSVSSEGRRSKTSRKVRVGIASDLCWMVDGDALFDAIVVSIVLLLLYSRNQKGVVVELQFTRVSQQVAIDC